ncbi:potassium transporter Kup [Pseudoduganella namucuonensis]|uniref:Probable potassium transport system protein Kup n=1 Tax=Pseudoduganella namucuonensis TaxID=1035707 RepID=A0A1I7LPQ5_9BURK|nr:potassium transporter Kup [Pseudoduganella namucuonensis]SFV11691.1 KUP system potassium uptake protein [Pseudoduganella namucuonensis]
MTSASSNTRLATLSLAAIGIVYGDIGTSPLYTMKEVFSREHGIALTHANLLGVVSLIVWGLTIIVSLKYVALILRADNRGEGGVMALMALAMSSVTRESRWFHPLMLVGLAGTALFFGDGVITPAISVLSAIEGLEVATPAFQPYVIPLTVAVLVALYTVQHHGTAGIGKWFGPVVLVWFIALGAMGVVNIAANPSILAALDPRHALRFLVDNGWLGFAALGAIFLAFTGAEALYADLGHFGKRPIRLAWFVAVFPALSLNYLGQGALLMSNPEAVSNPFYHQLGSWSVYPLVAMATVATVIASQATISATFSVTQSAISLGFLPRMRVIHTSEREIGQVYIPLVNWLQLLVVLAAVVGFGSSTDLAAAYGIAVTTTMVTTTVLTFFVIRHQWKYNLFLCWAATSFFLAIDLAFFLANTLKIAHGGWFPLLLGTIAMTVLMTWHEGRGILFANLKKHAIPLGDFLQSLFASPPLRVPGTAVFFRAEGDGVPHALLHNLLHNKILHERIVFLTVFNRDIPAVPEAERVRLADLGHNCHQLDVYYGFKDERDILRALELSKGQGMEFAMMETSFFIARQTVIPVVGGGGMALWRDALFATMSRNARDAAEYYRIPTNRVIELGTQIEI